MSAEQVILLIVASIVFFYIGVAMFKPEWF
jgi:hypothetical protein